jgi:hypothetical protein
LLIIEFFAIQFVEKPISKHPINMKKILLSLCILTLFLSCKAQQKGTIGLYGYKQAVLPGIASKGVMKENNTMETSRPKPKFNFFIYTASRSSITPTMIWLFGQPYSVKFHSIDSTQVEYIHPGGMPLSKKHILVPKTGKKILQLTLVGPIEAKANDKAASLAKKNELVIVYGQKGKTYYSSLSKLKAMEPMALQ